MEYNLLKKYENNQKDEETYKIIGAAMSVHRELGPGFLEAVYGDALEIEFQQQGIPYEREKEINIIYKGKEIRHTYYADFICYGHIIVELKAVEKVTGIQEAQVIHYLKATNFDKGLLFNFNDIHLQPKRFINRHLKSL